MSTGKRELILVRIFEILQSMTEAPIPEDLRLATVVRNRGKLAQDALPAGYLLDGDETTSLAGDRRGRVQMSTAIMVMRPQVFVVLKSRQPQNLGVGEELNRFRALFLLELAADQALLALLGPNGDLAYEGMITDLKTGMPMEGQAQINLAIRYVLNPRAT